jgi:hypothetical protein
VLMKILKMFQEKTEDKRQKTKDRDS